MDNCLNSSLIAMPLILHATLVLFLLYILPSPIRSHHFVTPAILISENSAVSVLTSILKVSTIAISIVHYLTPVTISTTIFLSIK